MANFAMPGGTPSEHVYPVRVPSAQATALLADEIDRFILKSRAFKASRAQHRAPPACDPETVEDDGHEERDETPRHVICGEAGLGKSTTILSRVSALVDEGWNVLCVVPALPLADDLARHARNVAGITSTVVVRGRDRPDPEQPGRAMCWKADLAAEVAKLRFSVKTTLCDDGKGNRCIFADQCGYMKIATERRQGGTLYVAAHNHLSIPSDLLGDSRIDLVIIDESFWRTLTREGQTAIDRFLTPRLPNREHRSYRPKKGESDDEAAFRFEKDAREFAFILDKARRAFNLALMAERQVELADLRAVNLSVGDCRFAAGIEYTALRRPDVHPGMPEDIQREIIRAAAVRETFGFARLWKLMGDELGTTRNGLLMSVRFQIGKLVGDMLTNVIKMDFSVDPRFRKTPILMIDADADERIIDRFYPGSTVSTIAAEWSEAVNVKQVMDRTGSARSLTADGNRERLRLLGLDMADRHRDWNGTRPLMIVQQAIEETWKAEGRDLAFDGGPANPRAPFEVAHFNGIRGKDGWKRTTGLIVAGRIEPRPDALDALTRGVFYRSEETVATIEPDTNGRVALPRRSVRITARDGSQATVSVSYHPDERADAILRQIREAEVSQAIARVRPIHRPTDAPCEIVVASNLPLRIQPATLVRWMDIVPDRWREMELRGFVPDLAPDVASAYPDLFPSADAVRQAASRRAADRKCDESPWESFYGACHTFKRMARFECGREGNRRKRGGWIRMEEGDTVETVAQRVREALPGAFGVVVTAPLPEPLEYATAALDAAHELDAYVAEVERDGERVWWRDETAWTDETGPDPSRWNAPPPLAMPAGPPDPGDRLWH